MTEKIYTLIKKVCENQNLANQSQVRFLQSQMKPHFLYNTLSTIALHCKMIGDETTYQMVHALSKLMQGRIFRSGEIEIQLGEELELIEAYLYLQNMRFPDKIHYNIRCGDGLADVLIPRLSIQPLVENAVVHGLENKKEPGTVWIEISVCEDTLQVEVRDDGVGFSSDQQEDQKHTHMGLKNIQQMIQNMYGREYGIRISSIQGKGTTAMLRLPVERGNTNA